VTRPKLGFLPVFFTILGVAFAAALWVRLRSYSNDDGHGIGHASLTRSADASEAPSLGGTPQPQTVVTETVEQTTTVRRRRATATSTADWQIVPVNGGGTSTTTAATRTSAPLATPKPSLLSRLVAPIMNAMSGGPSRGRGGAPSPSSPPGSSQSPSSSGSGHATDTTGTQRDPSSDTQPPQLVSISFTPPQIHDGEETVLAVQASDDLSGIRSVSGTITAPSGAVQGFACQREGETDRYTAHVAVPKDAADGIWRVNYLSLIDNASNGTTIAASQGSLPASATFRVISSRSDTTGPTLKAIWTDKPAIRAGEKTTIFVDADDDKAGVNLVSGVLLSPAKIARIGFVCRPGSSTWECEVSTPTCIDCGDWQLEQIQLQDKANNMTTIRAENPLVANLRVNITSDRCDSAAPVLQALVLDRNAVSNAQDSVINVSATASDDQCGLMSMSGQVSGPTAGGGAPRLYFSFTPSEGATWVGRISVPHLAAKGVWRVTWIQVLDQAHNLKTYSAGDPVLANAGFNVQ
jgi:hypothetical protein